MGLWKVQRSVQGTNGTTRDEYVNTFYLQSNLDPGGLAPNGQTWAKAVATTLDQFFTNEDSNGVTILEYMSRRYQGPSLTKFYQNGPTPTSPTGPPVAVVDDGLAFAPPDEPSLPEECAACLSYNVVPAGVIPARARGRIYIGPLSVHAMDEVTSNDQPVRLAPAFIQRLLEAGPSLSAALAAAGWDWHLFSRANNQSAMITNWSVDDAFDTIRNRGSAPSVRISA